MSYTKKAFPSNTWFVERLKGEGDVLIRARNQTSTVGLITIQTSNSSCSRATKRLIIKDVLAVLKKHYPVPRDRQLSATKPILG